MPNARDAFEARLTAYLAANPSDWGEVTFDPANTAMTAPLDGSAFIVLQFPASVEEPISIGSPGANTHRESGGARFVLMIPIGSGETVWRPRVDAMRAHFRSTTFGGVVTYGASPPAIDDSADEGSYWCMAWVVRYHFDVLG